MMRMPLTKYIKLSHLYCYDPCSGMLERPRDDWNKVAKDYEI